MNNMSLKIALILNDDFSMYHFRGSLICHLIELGHDVTTIVPQGDFEKSLESLGARVITLPITRFISPLADFKLLVLFYRLFRREKFDVVHNMTIKPNIFGSIAARLARTERVVCLVSGAGFVFSNAVNIRGRIFRSLVKRLYKFGLGFSDVVWFQNPDDRDEFVCSGLIPSGKAIVIKSGGIDTDAFDISSISKSELKALRDEFNISQDKKCIVMVAARMIWSKGVREFVNAAAEVEKTFPDWHFIMLTPKDTNSPDAVPENFMRSLNYSNLTIIDKFREDVKNFVALADIMVLVSYYREGVPRSLLEGLALSKPIITSTCPGCKEVVEEGRNGYKIAPKDSIELSKKLQILMLDEELRADFGSHSRTVAEKRFDSKIVVDSIIKKLYDK
jgi:N,N'-diacetylbacillosaminyl-diphospho-undecaprenol alpha-1,3-N-acetylgalactosaminyltransferase